MKYTYFCIVVLLSTTFVGQGAEKIVDKTKRTSCSWWVIPIGVALVPSIQKAYHFGAAVYLSNEINKNIQRSRTIASEHNQAVIDIARCSISTEISQETSLPPVLATVVEQYARVGMWEFVKQDLVANKLLFTTSAGIIIGQEQDFHAIGSFLPLTREQKTHMKKSRKRAEQAIEKQKQMLRANEDKYACHMA